MSVNIRMLRQEAIDRVYEECLEKGICPNCYMDDDYPSTMYLTNKNNEPRYCECGFEE